MSWKVASLASTIILGFVLGLQMSGDHEKDEFVPFLIAGIVAIFASRIFLLINRKPKYGQTHIPGYTLLWYVLSQQGVVKFLLCGYNQLGDNRVSYSIGEWEYNLPLSSQATRAFRFELVLKIHDQSKVDALLQGIPFLPDAFWVR